MEQKKGKLKEVAAGAGKSTLDLLDKTKKAITHVVDQNDDGSFNKEDVAIVADAVGNTVKAGAKVLKENAKEQATQIELKTLKPIFYDDIMTTDFCMSKFIRILDRDKRHADSTVCQGSIGYLSTKGLRVVNIFTDSLDSFNITLYPNNNCEFYYVDPTDSDRYIALSEYFTYLEMERLSELQIIAQALGAKHFRVTYMEEKAYFSKKHTKGEVNAGKASADAVHDVNENEFTSLRVAAENDFPGHSPIMPHHKYLKNDPSIRTLISMRMDESSPLTHQKIMIKMSNSSGIKENDAAKIDALLKGIKCSGNTTVTTEVKREARKCFDYEIDF